MYSIENTPNTVLLQLASKARALRKKQGYSQQELADRSGVSLGSLKRFEQKGFISLEALLKLAHVLNRLDDFKPLFAVLDQTDEIERLFSPKTRRT